MRIKTVNKAMRLIPIGSPIQAIGTTLGSNFNFEAGGIQRTRIEADESDAVTVNRIAHGNSGNASRVSKSSRKGDLSSCSDGTRAGDISPLMNESARILNPIAVSVAPRAEPICRRCNLAGRIDGDIRPNVRSGRYAGWRDRRGYGTAS